MSTVELRKRLIEKIEVTEDENLLEDLYRLLQLEIEEVKPYELSQEQIQAIDEARQEIKIGHFLSNEDSDTDIDEWLKR